MDGVTFDYESPIAFNAPERGYYTALVAETTTALHAAVHGSQVSVCAAWSPDDIDGRAYDYTGLAAGSDFLYMMVYDTRRWEARQPQRERERESCNRFDTMVGS